MKRSKMTTMTAPVKKRGLGRGLSNLLSDNLTFNDKHEKTENIVNLPIEKLKSGKYQPRLVFSNDALNELADSIRMQGIIQPILVRKLPSLHYEIIAGERRFRAAQLAGLSEIPAIIRNIPDESAVAVALIENIQRENLNAIEEAHALKRLQDEFHLTQQQVAEAVGKSRVNITHLLRLLDLPSEIQTHLQSGKIDKGHAKVLLALSKSDQIKACDIIISKNLSVRDCEKLIQSWQHAQQLNPANTFMNQNNKKIIDPNIGALERQLSDKLKTPVIIRHHKKGRGKLIIHYRNLDVLEDIFGKLKF